MHIAVLGFCAFAHLALARQTLISEGLGAISYSLDESCSEIAWPPTKLGKKLVPQAPDAELQHMLGQIDTARIKAIIEKLVSFGTRHTASSQTDPKRGIGAARDWIASELRTIATSSEGRMTVEVSGYTQNPTSGIPFPVTISNIVAKLEGATDSGRVYVITGHYDSRCSNNADYTSDAPGANDDASGVAVMMELARIIATKRPAATILFGAVAGEEQGLFGSAFLAQSLKNSGTNVEAMLNNDIIGSPIGDKGQKDEFTVRLFAQGPPLTESRLMQQQRLSIGAENDSPARELARFAKEVSENSATGMRNVAVIYRLDRYGRGGDHSSFLRQGYAAVRFTEPNENFKHQHQNVRVDDGTQYGDLPEFVDYEYVARVGRVNLATLWSLSNAPGIPRNVTMNSASLSNDSIMRWVKASGDVVGYEIVWRATDTPFWTHVVDVGNIDTAILPLSKDNVIFGVRAVGRNGYRSPAVIPFPGAA